MISPASIVVVSAVLAIWLVSGCVWLWASRRTASLSEVGDRFKVYTWLIYPSLLALGVSWLWLTDFATVASTSSLLWPPNQESVAIAGLFAFVLVVMTIVYGNQSTKNLSPDDINAFLTAEVRELPSLVVIAPVAEEILFRGLGSIAFQNLGVFGAGIVTSVLFALIHIRPWLMVAAFLAGLVLFALYAVTENLLLPIIVHATVNTATWAWMRFKVNSVEGTR